MKYFTTTCFITIVLLGILAFYNGLSTKGELSGEFKTETKEIIHELDQVKEDDSFVHIYGLYNNLLNDFSPYNKQEQEVIDYLAVLISEKQEELNESTTYQKEKEAVLHLLNG
jgi:hypothetical protein